MTQASLPSQRRPSRMCDTFKHVLLFCLLAFLFQNWTSLSIIAFWKNSVPTNLQSVSFMYQRLQAGLPMACHLQVHPIHLMLALTNQFFGGPTLKPGEQNLNLASCRTRIRLRSRAWWQMGQEQTSRFLSITKKAFALLSSSAEQVKE